MALFMHTRINRINKAIARINKADELHNRIDFAREYDDCVINGYVGKSQTETRTFRKAF